MSLLLNNIKYIILVAVLCSTGCSSIVNTEGPKSIRAKAHWYCLNKVFDYEVNCNCDLYPKGVTKERYCDTWANLTAQGYNVELEIPAR